jgi:hypothetical protein
MNYDKNFRPTVESSSATVRKSEQAALPCPPVGWDVLENSVSAAPPTPVMQTTQPASTNEPTTKSGK